MRNLRKKFGEQLKIFVQDRKKLDSIGEWAYSYYWENIEDTDDEFDDILLTLNTMEFGPEFYFTYEELDKIADDLIAGKEVKL